MAIENSFLKVFSFTIVHTIYFKVKLSIVVITYFLENNKISKFAFPSLN
jgi:hypothetical protein